MILLVRMFRVPPLYVSAVMEGKDVSFLISFHRLMFQSPAGVVIEETPRIRL